MKLTLLLAFLGLLTSAQCCVRVFLNVQKKGGTRMNGSVRDSAYASSPWGSQICIASNVWDGNDLRCHPPGVRFELDWNQEMRTWIATYTRPGGKFHFRLHRTVEDPDYDIFQASEFGC